MNRTLVTTGTFVLTLGLAACQSAPVETPRAASSTPIQRGEYLVTALGCDDCHSPKKMTAEGPVPDMSRRLSGHEGSLSFPAPPTLPPGPWGIVTTMDLTAWAGPWGVSYAINLTPDEGSGLGVWTEESFVNAIRTGKHMGVARPILPPMPWASYSKLTDDDLEAIFAFLQSLPPIANSVPNPVIAPPPPATP